MNQKESDLDFSNSRRQEDSLKSVSQLLPLTWQSKIHDKGLLKAISLYGFSYGCQLVGNKEFGFEEVTKDKILANTKAFKDIVFPLLGFEPEAKPTDNEILNSIFRKRVEEICMQFKDSQHQSKILVKRSKNETTPMKKFSSKHGDKGDMDRGIFKTIKDTESGYKRLKPGKNLIKKNDQGDIVYPIIVNNSLVIENFGVIDWSRPQYHTEKNLFPIGFRSVREHQSVNNPGERC